MAEIHVAVLMVGVAYKMFVSRFIDDRCNRWKATSIEIWVSGQKVHVSDDDFQGLLCSVDFDYDYSYDHPTYFPWH